MMGYTRCYEYFSEYLDTFEIAKYEFDSLLKLSTIVNAPKPYKLWNIYEVKSAILIMEYIPGIPLVNQKIDEKVINEIFLILKILRDNNFVHGDFRLENLILSDDKKIYIIDPIKTNDSVNIEFRLNLDLAIAIWTLFKKIDKKIVLSIALKYFEKKILVDALMLLPLEVFKEDDEYSNI
jgi:RIO-like serine/threonine protein kinase